MATDPITESCEYVTIGLSPIFSVVVPTHNRAELLKQAIDSVLGQTFGDFELLVVDDHSTDHTQDVVHAFEDPRIKLLVNDRTPGGAGARNVGVFEARGEWIAFLDDDDVWLPQKLERQYAKTQEVTGDVSLIYAGVSKCAPDLSQIYYTSAPSKEGRILNDLLYRNCIGTYSSVIIRSSTLRLTGGLDEAFPAMQDKELYIRIAMIAQVSFIAEPLVLYRTNIPGSISSNFGGRLTASILIRQKYWHLIKHNLRQRHRAASRIFIFAWRSKEWPTMLSELPWTLAGVFCDPLNLVWVINMMRAAMKGYW